MKKYFQTVSIIFILFSAHAFALNTDTSHLKVSKNALVKKQQEEKEIPNNFAVALYKQNYILPFYYTGSPYNAVYTGETPDDEKLNNTEVKYQISFKIPLWTHIFHSSTSLFLGYTQFSYWQLYNKKPFFRSTDYEPELFTETKVNWLLWKNFYLNSFKFGLDHQSNGFGNDMERTWNRAYIEGSLSNEHALISLRSWYVFHDSSYEKYNPHMVKYLGYGEIVIAYKLGPSVISLLTHSLVEHGGRYATGELNFSVPINPYINAFAQVFSGYGQSLIEYNHRTNSFGIGIALNNFI